MIECAKTMVARIIPRMKRMWKVGVTLDEVVARTISTRRLLLAKSTFPQWIRAKEGREGGRKEGIHVATVAANNNAAKTQRSDCEDPSSTAALRFRP